MSEPSAPPDSPEVDAPQPTAPDVPPLSDEIDDLDEVVIRIGAGAAGVRVDAKVAATDAERRQGLMGVPALPDGAGMLFVFPQQRTGGFWMKDTLVPLDIGFADADGNLLEILWMDPCEQEPCPVYDPGVAYRYALEVPQGWFAAMGVEEGDALTIGPVTGRDDREDPGGGHLRE